MGKSRSQTAPDDPATDSVLPYVGPRLKDFKPHGAQATQYVSDTGSRVGWGEEAALTS
jgi:hypothetical protein